MGGASPSGGRPEAAPFARNTVAGSVRRPARPGQQLVRRHVLGQQRVNRLTIRQTGKIVRQQTGREVTQLQVQRCKLDIGGCIVPRRHQEVFQTQHRPGGIELGRPEALDAMPHAGRRQPSFRQTGIHRAVDPRMEQVAPVKDQRLVAAECGQFVRLGTGQQHDRIGQVAGVSAQLARRRDVEQGGPANDVGLHVRHAHSQPDQTPVGLDDAAQDARRHQDHGGVHGDQRLLQLRRVHRRGGNRCHGTSQDNSGVSPILW